jgi:hypothetical protein
MAELQRLIYRSTATGTTASLLNVATILGESQRNNDRDGLTGALAAHGDRYIQVIEGRPSTLDSLLRRLERDNRHKAIEVIDRRAIDRRRFDGWAMAHARFGPGDASTLERIVNQPDVSVGELVDLLETAIETRATTSPH